MVEERTQTGVVQNYTIDFRGSSQNSKTYISGNYYDESGTVKGYDFNRLSFRINHDQTVKPWLTLKPKLSVAYTQEKTDRDLYMKCILICLGIVHMMQMEI